MHLLLDTHIYLWWLMNDRHLSAKARSLIMDAEKIYVRSASIWEAAIKKNLGKLDVDMDELICSIESEGFFELPVTVRHAARIAELENHHRDPFDRILIAQALSEPLRILTADQHLVPYTELVELV